MTKVYITDITPLLKADVYKYYYDRIGEWRRIKADKLKNNEAKARSVGAGAVLRFAIEDSTPYNYDELTFDITKEGKPYVCNAPFHFSLSHSGKYAVCAISDSEIGIDIELEKEFDRKFKDRFAENTLEWTKKEAKGKVSGVGFFDTSPLDHYVFSHKKTDGYIITVCSNEKVDDFLFYHLPFPS